jgi:AraC-like DNA-binding protein
MMALVRASGACPGSEIVTRRRFACFTLAKFTAGPGEVVPWHAHSHPRFTMVLRGCCKESRGDAAARPVEGLVFLPAGVEHSIVAGDSGVILLCVDFDPRWLERACSYAPLPEVPAEFRGGLMARYAAMLVHEFHHPDEVSRLALEGILLGMVAEASRRRAAAPAERPAPEWLERARAIFHARYAGRISLARVAAEVRVHPVQLARAFRKCYRCSTGEYVRRLRVEYSARQLASRRPLAEIALAAGFADQSHFTRIFKRHTGMTPAEFRQSLAGS